MRQDHEDTHQPLWAGIFGVMPPALWLRHTVDMEQRECCKVEPSPNEHFLSSRTDQ